ncbi:MAG: metal ABC transporter ATP-binding protein [Anaerolineales bacterium]|jgi:manganese/iron transport system ATP-binding protein
MATLISHFAPHESGSPPIRIDSLSVRYNGTLALDDLKVEIPPGARVAIVGPNGAGKTTLLQVIAGTLEPSSGKVSVFGRGPHGHVCIAYVPQRSHVNWSFPVSVQDVVMMGRIRKLGIFRWPRSSDWALVARSLEQVGMLAYRDRPIGELSGGQQQRVFLAQALAQEAEIILLDEPLTGLDLPSQEAILNALDTLHTMGITVLIATHDLQLAAERFDLVMLLNRRLISFGKPDEALSEKALLSAYGGHLHVVPDEKGSILLTDTCCDGDDEVRHG